MKNYYFDEDEDENFFDKKQIKKFKSSKIIENNELKKLKKEKTKALKNIYKNESYEYEE